MKKAYKIVLLLYIILTVAALVFAAFYLDYNKKPKQIEETVFYLNSDGKNIDSTQVITVYLNSNGNSDSINIRTIY